jgi:hypothetical protein
MRRYGRTHSTRLPIVIEKKMMSFCMDHDLRPSEVLKEAVSCLLTHSDCAGKKALLERIRQYK